jgi:hypothetical protein
LRTSGSLVISPISLASRSIVSREVLAGAAMPNHTPTLKPGSALSAIVGTCGRIAMRSSDAVAKGFTLPASTN